MKIISVIFLMIVRNFCYAQDPTFSQFFSSPLNVNPALTANINADWRAISNYRSQWMGDGSPYVTGTISYDSKILQHKNAFIEENNFLGLGGMLMFDRAMEGVAKSTFASLNLSYNIKLIDGNKKHRLAIGFGGSYGHRTIDYSRLNFEDQWTGFGFNTNLPTGESALSNMKDFLSINTGITYSITSENSNFDMGVAAFHVNKPRQTFLKDENQTLAIRKVAHANFETYLNDRTILNVNGIYQLQSGAQKSASYLSAGGGLGYYLGDDKGPIINAGLWYWKENGFMPYVGLSINNLQFGFTYELITSKLNNAARKPKSVELSIILRGSKEPSKNIPCPWK
ncbi:MAG TPA: PorP/SprF family type IX secretion system membrane protein [Chitinophagaceae bacterium]|nr:PorP/SprF family type IX secretion system membrane protein [Chitinophagaceae bacterium]